MSHAHVFFSSTEHADGERRGARSNRRGASERSRVRRVLRCLEIGAGPAEGWPLRRREGAERPISFFLRPISTPSVSPRPNHSSGRLLLGKPTPPRACPQAASRPEIRRPSRQRRHSVRAHAARHILAPSPHAALPSRRSLPALVSFSSLTVAVGLGRHSHGLYS